MNFLLSSQSDDTLDDEAWKDSFDRLLDDRTALRDRNVIKRDVRASFNMDSSCENTSYKSSINKTNSDFQQPNGIPEHKKKYLDVPSLALCKTLNKHTDKIQGMSTPLRVRDSAYPFETSLSPIGIWKFEDVEKKNEEFACTGKNLETNVANNESNNDFPHCILPINSKANQKSAISLLVENIMSRKRQKRVCFNTKLLIENSPLLDHRKSLLPLQPGKWRKSLNLWRKTQSTCGAANVSLLNRNSIKSKNGPEAEIAIIIKASSNTLPACNRKSVLNRKSGSLSNNIENNNFEQQLLRRCCQKNTVLFADAYKDNFLQNCCKIGEGAFAEVFLYKKPKGKKEDNVVLKIIPIEGKNQINGETQKSFEQILQEVVISMELCALNDKNRETNFTPGFVNLKRVKCVTGEYPTKLQKLWEAYDNEKESENDHPECFNSDQKFVVLEMAYCGQDLEKFVFQNAEQSYYALLQIIYTLAIGEKSYQFEHRDLHWGNVLVLKTNNKYISYKFDGKVVNMPTKGIRITIIDYTLSRITYDNVSYYNDLSCDPELFTATGDCQFDIYRKMRETLKDNWEKFNPKTNIFWISYIIIKLVNGVTYSKSQQKVHLQFLEKLKELNSTILMYNSCCEFAFDMSSKLH